MKQNNNFHLWRVYRYVSLVSICVLILLMLSFSVHAGGIPASSQTIPLPQPVGTQALGDGLGSGVALDGDNALVGAAEALHVFVRSGTTWMHQAALTATDNSPLSIGDIDGDTAVGINTTINTPGAIVVFVRSGTTWTQQAVLTIDQNVYPDHQLAGSAVLQGDQLLVGVSDRSINGDKPTLIIFSYKRSGSTWSLETTFNFTDNQGHSLAADGDLAAVFYEDDGPFGYDPTGALNVFRYNGSDWDFAAGEYFADGDPDVPDTYGSVKYNADVSGNTIANNGYIYNYDSNDGSMNYLYDVVFVFTLSGNTLTRQALLKPTNNLGHHYYMQELALEGNNLLVSVRDPDTNVISILYYQRSGSTWTLQSTLNKAPTGMALSGNTLLLGAASENAAYVYVLSGTTWTQQAKLTLAADPTELLVNGGFEVADNNNSDKPAGWTLKPTGSLGYVTVLRDCSYPAHSGFCSLKFYGNSNKAIQNVDLNTHNLQAGDKIRLTGFYNKLGNTNYVADVWLYISYANLPDDQGRITLKRPTNGWQALPNISATLKAQPTRVRVVIQASAFYNQLIYFDDISLKLVTNAPFTLDSEGGVEVEVETLPLPEAASGLTGLGK